MEDAKGKSIAAAHRMVATTLGSAYWEVIAGQDVKTTMALCSSFHMQQALMGPNGHFDAESVMASWPSSASQRVGMALHRGVGWGLGGAQIPKESFFMNYMSPFLDSFQSGHIHMGSNDLSMKGAKLNVYMDRTSKFRAACNESLSKSIVPLIASSGRSQCWPAGSVKKALDATDKHVMDQRNNLRTHEGMHAAEEQHQDVWRRVEVEIGVGDTAESCAIIMAQVATAIHKAVAPYLQATHHQQYVQLADAIVESNHALSSSLCMQMQSEGGATQQVMPEGRALLGVITASLAWTSAFDSMASLSTAMKFLSGHVKQHALALPPHTG